MKDKKIAIIGAGPAGITLAQELSDKGFKDIILFGEFEEAQLKTKEVEGITFDVAACLLHLGYQQTVVRLCKRFGFNVHYLKDEATLTNKELIPNEIAFSQKVETFLQLPFYFLVFTFWLILHRTPFRKWFSQPMEDFLRKIGLDGLAQSFAMGPGGIAQGYGFLNEITAYHGFRWYRPRLFLTPLFSKYQKGVATIEEGYETLFRHLFSQFDHIPQKIKIVNPRINKVELIDENNKTYFFDEVIIACPLSQLSFPHAFLLKAKNMESTSLFSFLFTSATLPPFKDRAYLTDLIQAKTKNKALVIRTGGKTNKGHYLYWAVGYKKENTTDEELKQLIINQLESECRLDVQQIHFYKTFDYNLRFSNLGVKEGLPHKFDLLQGNKRIWYSGGQLSHWDISSIYEYNRLLVNKMVYKWSAKNLVDRLRYWKNNIFAYFRHF
jgi:hypothetical protein